MSEGGDLRAVAQRRSYNSKSSSSWWKRSLYQGRIRSQEDECDSKES